MKRRIMAIILLLSLLLALSPSGSAAGIYFVAVNDTVPLTLSTDVAPYFFSGILLVPHTAFSVSGLGITPSYNSEKRILTLFSRSQRLVFDLDAGSVTDEKGTTQDTVCALKNGVAFLPVAFSADHFGIAVSVQTSSGGYQVLRFTNGTQVYDNALFIQKAENLISYRVQQYLNEQAAAAPPTTPESDPPKQPDKPTSATTTPTTTTPSTPAEPETPQKAPITVYLAVTGADTMSDALRSLTSRDIPAVFFLTAEEIGQNPSLVLSIRAAGYPVGLTVPEDETDVAGSLAGANEALDALIQSKTLLTLLTRQQAANAAGYFVVDRTQAVSAAAAIGREGRSSLVVCTGNCSAAVSALKGADARFRQLRETSPF